jgi:hypothetical protein
MKRGKRSVALFLATGLLLGCSGRLVNISPVPPTGYSQVGQAGGTACGMLLLSMIPIAINDRVERAYARALGPGEATSLTDTSITESWYFALIGTVVCTRVEGVAIRRIAGPPPQPLDSR